jgi:hypothetical protein
MNPEPGATDPAQDATDFIMDSIDHLFQLMLTNYQPACLFDAPASPAKD